MKALIKEKNSPRGLVPSSSFGKLDDAYNNFLGDVDPNNSPQAQHALACATDARFREFLRLIGEPRYSRWSLAAVAKTCDISLPEWADFWRKSQLQRALLQATNAIPKLTNDLIGDAATQHNACERCDGLGEVEVDSDDDGQSKGKKRKSVRVCPACKGQGTIRKPGDTHARDRLLEMTGLGGKKGGAAVIINQNFGGMGVESATERLSQITFDVSADDDSTLSSDSDNTGL